MAWREAGTGAFMSHIKMKELPSCERPYEKGKLFGVEALSDEELLSIILRTGTKERRVSELVRDIFSLAEEYGGINNFNLVPENELLAIQGIGKVKILMLKSVFELSKRLSKRERISGNIKIESPLDAVYIMQPDLRDLDVEEVWALYLDGRNGIIRKEMITRGTSNSSMISIKDIFKEALRCNATGLFIFHNHPSKDPTPSLDDISITRQIYKAALMLGICFVDHIIIGGNKYVSLKDKGYI